MTPPYRYILVGLGEFVARRPRYHGHVFAFDVILLVRGRFPRHIPDGM